MSFETTVKELEQIVAKLNGGNATLTESLELYKQGLTLCTTMTKQLKVIEKEVKTITEKNGTITEGTFEE